jgi:lipopolysaccharide transport system permease protein
MAKAMPIGGEEAWTTIIKPRSGFFSLDLRELFHYRDLVGLFVKRDIATVYKQTVLGPLWFVIQPIATTIIYTFVFGNLAGLSTDGIPRTLFYFGGTMLWHYFQISLLNISDTFIVNAALFNKVYFPRLVMPLSKILSNLVALGIQAAMLLCFYVYYITKGMVASPSFSILLIPLIVIWLGMLATGFGMIVSSLTTKYRDLRTLINFGMGLWMYATPVVYPVSQIPGKLKWLMIINPVSAPIELFRYFMFKTGNPNWNATWISLGICLLLFFIGLILFRRSEGSFVDIA